MIDKRVSWDEYFMQQCDLISTRGTCDRRYVGAVIVKDKRIIATGYNGSLPGIPHCSDPEIFYECGKCGRKFSKDEVRMVESFTGEVAIACEGKDRCLGCHGDPLIGRFGGHDMEDGSCIRTVHAEINAIAQAARMGIATEGATLYVNTFPCWKCFQTIVSSGIKEVVHSGEYRTDDMEYKRKVIDRVLNTSKMLKGFVLRRFKNDEKI